jgi:hypothetical protein
LSLAPEIALMMTSIGGGIWFSPLKGEAYQSRTRNARIGSVRTRPSIVSCHTGGGAKTQ